MHNWDRLIFSPLWVTLKTGIVASVFSFFIGIAFAELVINTKGRVRRSGMDC